VVPADRKWYRNWAVANLLLAYLDGMHLDYPEVDLAVDELRARLAADHARPAGSNAHAGDRRSSPSHADERSDGHHTTANGT
jgi:hypothetical protein